MNVFVQLQSIAWAVLAFLGISLYACDLEVAYEKENPVFYLYFVYFLSKYTMKEFQDKNSSRAGL
jgi:hypothetical protein